MSHSNISPLYPTANGVWTLEQKGDDSYLKSADGKGTRAINSITGLIFNLCNGKKSVVQIERHLCELFPNDQAAVKKDLGPALQGLEQTDVITLKKERRDAGIPAATPARPHRKLCIGMATFDDYDGVYFSLQAIRMYHPEILDECEFIVIDNNPEGVCASYLKQLEGLTPTYRYLPNGEIKGTAVRDFVFQEANADYVLCMDSHVFFVPGSIRRLIDYFDANPDCQDLLQGPLINDDLNSISTHFVPGWSHGMYGSWGNDERAADVDGDAFDIPMQGLGSFACRKDAWPGFNPRFAGFGGEEGYIHEKFRQGGHRTLCLPFFRWMHRFNRPMGTRYQVQWQDRIRNYMIGFDELGWDTEEFRGHFSTLLGEGHAKKGFAKVEEEMASGFYHFDALYSTYSESRSIAAAQMQVQFESLKVDHRLRLVEFRETPVSLPVERVCQFRKIVERVQKQPLQTLLLVPDQFAFDASCDDMFNALFALLQQAPYSNDWTVIRLDEAEEEWDEATDNIGLQSIQADNLQGVYAIHARAFSALLEQLPVDEDELEKQVDCGRKERVKLPGMFQIHPAICFHE